MQNLQLVFYIASPLMLLLDGFFGRKFTKSISAVYFAFVTFFIFLIAQNSTSEQALQFFGLYFVEFLLSIDHVFVFLIILSSFKLKKSEQEFILTLGILFAIASRVAVILVGMKVIHLPFVIEILGILLIFTAIDAFKSGEKEGGIIQKVLSGVQCIFHKVRYGKYIIPAITIGLIDIIFALDSIPAALSFSKDINFMIWANVLTLIGMKSIFFVLSYMVKKFKYFKYSVGIMLIFVSLKLICHSFITIPTTFSVFFVVFCILSAIMFQILEEKLVKLRKKS